MESHKVFNTFDLEFDDPDVEEPEFIYETSKETELDDEDIPQNNSG